MKRLINFSGPVHTRQAREHAHRGRKERNQGSRSYTSSPRLYLAPELAMPRGEQFPKGPRVHRITRFFPLFPTSSIHRSIPFRLFILRQLYATPIPASQRTRRTEHSFIPSFDATQTGSRADTPEVLFYTAFDKATRPRWRVVCVACLHMRRLFYNIRL